MKQYLIIISILLANVVCGQKLDIKEVSLTDTFFIESIRNLYAKMDQKYDYFSQGLGYIKVYETRVGCDSISRQYWANPDLSAVKPYNAPHYYTFVSDRPVLIYIKSFNSLLNVQFSPKSLKRLNKMLSRYLLPSQKVKGRDENGKVVIKDKNFRLEYHYRREGFFLNYDAENKPSIHPDRSY